MQAIIATPQADPALTAATLYRRLLMARRNAENAGRDAAVATLEAAAADAYRDALEVEYRNLERAA